MNYEVKYRRHYVDHIETFARIESAWKFIEQMDADGSGYAAEIRQGKKILFTRYNPREGWKDADPRAVVTA